MDVCIRAVTKPDDDELRSLAIALREGDAVDGPISLAAQPPQAGRLGPLLDMITVAVGTGSAVADVLREVARYMLRRSTDLEFEVSKSQDGEHVKLSVSHLRSMSPDQIEDFISETASRLSASAVVGTELAGPEGIVAPEHGGV